jgi:hypothetical protein
MCLGTRSPVPTRGTGARPTCQLVRVEPCLVSPLLATANSSLPVHHVQAGYCPTSLKYKGSECPARMIMDLTYVIMDLTYAV